MGEFERAQWRLLDTGFRNGRLNMAIDEAIMVAVSEGKAPPTVRFYGWEPFCLSVGYAQSMAKEVDIEACKAAGVDWVRRPTGGRAVLHGDELTYSLIVPQDEPRVAGSIVESYRRLSAGLVEGLRRLGVQACEAEPRRGPVQEKSAACFDAPSHYEVIVNGHKLVGSAQMRRKGMVLQHGSVPLYGDITRILNFLNMPSEDRRERLREELRAKATTLEACLGRALPFEQVVAALVAGLADSLNLELRPGLLTPYEESLVMDFYNEKYNTDHWNFLR